MISVPIVSLSSRNENGTEIIKYGLHGGQNQQWILKVGISLIPLSSLTFLGSGPEGDDVL